MKNKIQFWEHSDYLYMILPNGECYWYNTILIDKNSKACSPFAIEKYYFHLEKYMPCNFSYDVDDKNVRWKYKNIRKVKKNMLRYFRDLNKEMPLFLCAV